MKKTVQKAIQKLSFSDQLKSTPKEIKMFFAGLLVIVAAIAFVLPNISGKMLQGNVLNVKSSVNGYGYGYGYGNDNGTRFGYGYVPLGQCFLIESDKETKISCPKKVNGNPEQKDLALQDGYGYGYGYGLGGTRGYFSFNIKNVGNVAIRENLEKLVWQLSINGVNQENVPGYTVELNDNRPSQQNNLIINPGQTSNVNGIIRLSTGVLQKNSYISFNLDYPQQDQNLGNNRISIVLNKDQNGYCQTPENKLACSMGLDSCPQRCKPDIQQPAVNCQSPMNVLACVMGLDSCPVECRSGITTPPVVQPPVVVVDCKTPENTLACSMGLDSCPVECRSGITTPPVVQPPVVQPPVVVVDCQTPENKLACSMGLDSCPVECRGTITTTPTPTTGSTTTRTPWLDRDNQSGAGDYETYKDFTVAPCGGKDNVVSSRYEAVDGKAHSDLKLHVDRLNVYCVNAENNNRCVDYKIQYECKN